MELMWFPTVVGVSLVGIRVLGVRLGWFRAVLCAWFGLATASFALTALTDDERPDWFLEVTLGLFVMLAWAGLFELFAQTRAETRRRAERNPIRAARQAFGRGRRTAEIALIATRFGLSRYGRRDALDPRGAATGRALRSAMEQAGGVYVKLGQFLSTRSDLLSSDIADELGRLQEDVDPLPVEVVRSVLTDEFGDPDAFFVRFDPAPVGSASIAQVHRAVLDDGRAVAVKVQRPDVAARVERDLDILTRLADKLEQRTQWAYEMRALDTLEAFGKSLTTELDFEIEARNLAFLAEAVHNHPRFFVPQPVPELTRKRVLVMDWVDGVPLSGVTPSAGDERVVDLSRALLRCLLDQILVAGTFHADPHPGNLYLAPDGRVAFLDGGAIGQLDRRHRTALLAVLAAIAAEDAGQLRAALRPITTVGRSIDESALEHALGNLLVEHLGAGARPGSEFVTTLMGLMRDFGLALEPVVGGALRAIGTLQPTLERLDPDFDLIGEAKAYGQTLFNPLWAGTHPRSPREEFEALLPSVLPMLAELPRRMERIAGTIERNEVVVGIRHFPTDSDRRFVDRIISQFVVVFVPAAIGLIGALLVVAANLGTRTESSRTPQVVGLGGVGLATLVLLSTLVAGLRRRRIREQP